MNDTGLHCTGFSLTVPRLISPAGCVWRAAVTQTLSAGGGEWCEVTRQLHADRCQCLWMLQASEGLLPAVVRHQGSGNASAFGIMVQFQLIASIRKRDFISFIRYLYFSASKINDSSCLSWWLVLFVHFVILSNQSWIGCRMAFHFLWNGKKESLTI